MANYTLKTTSSSAWSGYFSFNYTQSVSGNYSTVKVKVWVQKEDGSTSQSNSGVLYAYVKVDGVSKTLRSEGGVRVTTGGQWVGSDYGTDELTFTVSHNSNGSKSCSVEIEVVPPSGTALYNNGHRLTYDNSITLTTIPRASSISSATSVNIGSACKITWTPLSSSFYYALKFSMGSWSATTSRFRPGETSAYTYTGYTIPMDVANQIPNATGGTMSVSLYTYSSSSSSQIGSTSTSSFIVVLPDSVVPTISSFSATIDNSANSVVSGWGIALSGFSKVNVSASASGAYGSTITSFTISGGTYAKSLTSTDGALDFTGDIITSSGNKEFWLTCTDSRGRVSAISESGIIAFTSYTAPKMKKVTMSKNSSGKMVANATWTYDTVGGKNSASAKVYYKTTDATNWTTHSGTLSNGVDFTLSSLTPREDASYNFKVIVTDSLGNQSEKDAFSSTTTVLLDFKAGGTGLGVGKMCEDDKMEVGMDAIFFNEIYIHNNATTIEDYIRSIMKVLDSSMYGSATPAVSQSTVGQIFFKKVT